MVVNILTSNISLKVFNIACYLNMEKEVSVPRIHFRVNKNWLTKTGEITQFPHPHATQLLPTTHFRAVCLCLSANGLNHAPYSHTSLEAKINPEGLSY